MHSVSSSWNNLLSSGLTADDVSPHILRQIRNINLTLVVEIVLAMIFLWRNAQWDITFRVFGIGGALLVAISCLIAFRRYRYINLFSGCSTLIVYVGIVPGIYTSGGIAGEAILWLAVPPVLAGLLVNKKAIILAMLVSCSIVGHIALLELQGVDMISQTPIEHQMSQRILQNIAVIITLGILSYGYLRHVAQSQQQLEQSLSELEKEIAQREVAQQESIRSHNEKNQFFANMSHELRTPLNSVLGFSSQLVEKHDTLSPERLKKSLVSINRNATHLHALINDLFDLSQVESSTLSVTRRPIDLNNLISGIAEDLYGSANQSNLELIMDLETNLMTLGDPLRLSQVFLNLIDNAIKYTREGFIKISSQKSTETQIIIELIDNGDGLCPEDQEKIFDQYNHLRNPFHQPSTATALGLPLTKKLLELHDGKLEFESTLGEGSTSRVILPRDMPSPSP